MQFVCHSIVFSLCIVILGFHGAGLYAATKAMIDVYHSLAADGTTRDQLDKMVTYKQFNELVSACSVSTASFLLSASCNSGFPLLLLLSVSNSPALCTSASRHVCFVTTCAYFLSSIGLLQQHHYIRPQSHRAFTKRSFILNTSPLHFSRCEQYFCLLWLTARLPSSWMFRTLAL